MSRGKGAIPMREVSKILKKNGYENVRNNGHQIWSNGTNTISIPCSCCTYIIQRLFKENKIAY